MIVGLGQHESQPRTAGAPGRRRDAARHASSAHSREFKWTGTLVERCSGTGCGEVAKGRPGGALKRSQVFWTLLVLVSAMAGRAARAQQPEGTSPRRANAPSSTAPSVPQDPLPPKTPTDGKADDAGK